MTFILVTLTVLIVISFELVRRHRHKNVVEIRETITAHPNSIETFDRYLHPGHTWAEVSNSKYVSVGIDDFSGKMIGAVTRVDLPDVGQKIRQGDTLVSIRHGGRQLSEVTPVSGEVIEVNRKLESHPELLNQSPFERGWIAKILPANLETDLRNLLKGVAAEHWRESARAELIQMLSSRVGAVLQDGGQLVENVGDHLSYDEWIRLTRIFFPVVTTKHPQTKPMN